MAEPITRMTASEVYEIEVIEILEMIEELKSDFMGNMPAPDQCDDGPVIHWGHVGDAKRLKALLQEFVAILDGEAK